MSSIIGQPISRVDGVLKVTGGARYSSDIPLANLAHAVVLHSTIAKGRITQINTTAAEQAPGVLGIVTHLNAPKLHSISFAQPGQPPSAVGRSLPILQDLVIHFSGQQIGVVIAETLEQAEYAATLVQVTYAEESPITNLHTVLEQAFYPDKTDALGQPLETKRGDLETGWAAADVQIDQSYTTSTNNHNPLAPFASIAVWEGEKLTVYDASQWVQNVRLVLAATLGIAISNVRVVSQFVGGAFGCGLRAWPHVTLAAIAARHVHRAVKLVLTRQQMYTFVGYRPQTVQHLRLGATRDGKLTAIVHDNLSPTSPFDEFVESTTNNSRVLYACPNVATTHRLVRVNAGTPTYMRAPGESVGTFALESAMDELAYALELDPIELRLRNYAETNPETGLPWSSKSLRQCYQIGAERFGWSNRDQKPHSMRRGNTLIGLGVASAMYPVYRLPASAMARIAVDGSVLVQSSVTDISPGTYTVMTQVAAETLGLPISQVRFELGDTDMPEAPLQGGSMAMASVGSAVQAAALALRGKILGLAIADEHSPLQGVNKEDVIAMEGRLCLQHDHSIGETYSEILMRNQMTQLEAQSSSMPGEERQQYSMYSFGAQFAQVHIDIDLGMMRVARFLGVYGAGRIINAKTARSQMIGGIIGGVGQALEEETVMDETNGRIINANFGEYHVPVQADIGKLEHIFVDEHDPHVNPLGVKGIGELGLVGVAAAIANAVYHATGKRVRNLPITLDKVL
ncbi:MAG: xanthine dehydrogenase family protein molybdopterin-binding subunit [Stigonema ocellatum SAG 48.90 = DSM 106950]|nr:xanthine dehydrogenase family protein molybdopterin-binding subunit [Stigonema ocellatum SAG 48.90 = DSM 106950]